MVSLQIMYSQKERNFEKYFQRILDVSYMEGYNSFEGEADGAGGYLSLYLSVALHLGLH